MSFLKRLYYFSTGLIIGIVFLFFILNGKRTSCNYGPSARVIDNIISKELVLKYQTDSIVDDKLCLPSIMSLIIFVSFGKISYG